MADSPVVCLLGPRQCGKSALVQRLAPKRSYFSFDDQGLQELATTDPAGFLAGLPERVTLDEIQRVPTLLPAIKLAVDRDRRPGRFLLTGSANLLLLPRVSESLAGRMATVRLDPLTEAEKGRAKGRFLEQLLEGRLEERIEPGGPEPGDVVRRVLEGGFPEACQRADRRRRQWHRDYLDALIQKDARDVAKLRDLDQLGKLLSLLAIQTGQLLNIQAASRHLGIRRETVENHLAALERLFLVRRLPAWHPNDAKRLAKKPKVHVVDSGLAASLVDLSENDWITGRDRLGHILESFVLQQVRAQSTWTDPGLRFWHYRDKDQDEVDIVLTRGRKTWGVEVKASTTVAQADGRGLRKLAERCGDHFQSGVLLHAGRSSHRLGDPRILAVPLTELWAG